MSRSYIEKRIIEAGVKLCSNRISQKGTMVTADDIKAMKVKTFSPAVQTFYTVLGVVMFVLGMWIQHNKGPMAVTIPLVLFGFLNLAYAINGRPRSVSSFGESIDLADLVAEIVSEFSKRQDQSREKKG